MGCASSSTTTATAAAGPRKEGGGAQELQQEFRRLWERLEDTAASSSAAGGEEDAALEAELRAAQDGAFVVTQWGGMGLMQYSAWMGRTLSLLQCVVERSNRAGQTNVVARPTDDGSTALMYAAMNPHMTEEMFLFLLEASADEASSSSPAPLAATDNNGWTVLCYLAQTFSRKDEEALSQAQESRFAAIMVEAVGRADPGALDMVTTDEFAGVPAGATPRSILSEVPTGRFVLGRLDSAAATDGAVERNEGEGREVAKLGQSACTPRHATEASEPGKIETDAGTTR